jgi:xylulokinase
MRWMLEAQDRKIATSPNIRFVGGGALSTVTCQILADILGRKIETVPDPQNTGAIGAAIVTAVGLGAIESLEKADEFITVTQTYLPNTSNKQVYERGYRTFQKLYQCNKKNFRRMNSMTK